MYEFRLALQYLIPKKRSLSTALLSGVSALVISLIVWLVLVFLSVTKGIEQNWLQKLTSLHAPIRIQPTPTYYSSYYYKIDQIASASHYTTKTIGEKANTPSSDPFDPLIDSELSKNYPAPVKTKDGSLLDPVKIAFAELSSIPGISFEDYEISGALLRLSLGATSQQGQGAHLSQMSYLLSFSEKNPRLPSLFLEGTLLPPPDLSPNTPVYLPKAYLDQGAFLGSLGSLSYMTYTAGSSQEQQIPIQVAGFYDPGLLPIGSKCLLVPKTVTQTLLASTHTFSPDGTPTNGIFVWIQDLENIDQVKAFIENRLAKAGVAPYWKVSTYKEFEFAKDMLQQFQSDRLLLLLVASIILIVACCNILSLLVLLVNDKKKEIAVLRSLGASKRSIASIFALCGIGVGVLSTSFGTLAAWVTLKNLPTLLCILSNLQGHKAFNPLLFGQSSTSTFSPDALLFILMITPLLSLAAGILPAIKASRISPASALRSE